MLESSFHPSSFFFLVVFIILRQKEQNAVQTKTWKAINSYAYIWSKPRESKRFILQGRMDTHLKESFLTHTSRVFGFLGEELWGTECFQEEFLRVRPIKRWSSKSHLVQCSQYVTDEFGLMSVEPFYWVLYNSYSKFLTFSTRETFSI